MSSIDRVYTSCGSCHFAEFKDNEQTGCQLDMLEKVKQKTNKVIVEKETDGKKAKVILDYNCLRYRPADWGSKFGSDPQTQLDKEIYMKWHAILYIPKMQDQLKYAMSQVSVLARMDRKPDYLTVIYEQDDYIYPEELLKAMNDYSFTKWYIQVVAYTDAEAASIDKLSQVDIAVDKYKKLNCTFYTTFDKAITSDNLDHYSKIHNLIFEELAEVAYIEHDYGDTFFRIFHTTLNGNAIEGTLKEKIDFLTKRANPV